MPENSPEKQKRKGRPAAFDRQLALDAALRLFWEKGYEPASVAELCQAMGIKPPSLYCAFGNKASLFLETVKYYEEKYWSEPTRRLFAEPDIYKAIDDYFREAARILLSPGTPCGCMLVLAAVNISPTETEIINSIQAMRMETAEMFSKRLAVAIRAGQIPPDTDVPTLAASLNTYLEGMSLQSKGCAFLSQLLNIASSAIRLLPARDC